MLAIFFGKIFQQKDKGNRFNEGATSTRYIILISQKKWILFMIIALPEIATLSWFAWTERSTPEFTWRYRLEKFENIPSGIHEVLLYDYGEQGEINFENHNQAWVIHFDIIRILPPPVFAAAIIHQIFVWIYRHSSDRLKQTGRIFNRWFCSPISTLCQANNPYEPLSDLHVFWCSQPLDSRISHFEFTQSSLWKKARWFLSGKLSYERKVLLVSLRGKRSYKQAQEDLLKLCEYSSSKEADIINL